MVKPAGSGSWDRLGEVVEPAGICGGATTVSSISRPNMAFNSCSKELNELADSGVMAVAGALNELADSGVMGPAAAGGWLAAAGRGPAAAGSATASAAA